MLIKWTTNPTIQTPKYYGQEILGLHVVDPLEWFFVLNQCIGHYETQKLGKYIFPNTFTIYNLASKRGWCTIWKLLIQGGTVCRKY